MTTPTGQEIIERGREMYYMLIRPKLSEADRGKFVEINIETGEWLSGTDEAELSDLARSRFGATSKRYLHRVGYRVPHALGYPLSAVEEPI